MSRKFVLRSVSLFVMFMLTFSLVSTVLADSGDPTSINATVNGQDVTVSGDWTWEDASCNDSSVKIVGWAVAWGEPGFTGNPVPKAGGGSYYMGEAGTYPTTQGNHVFTDGQLCGSFPGPWGPLTHHYSAPGTYQICVIIYDLRANDIGDTGAHSDVAGGPNRNTDNSVEENFTEVENCEPGTVIIPSTPTMATEVRFNGANAPENVALGTTVTDQATLGETGNNGPVTGEVDFFVCGPTAAPANCNAGTSAGANKTISNGVANSNGVGLISSGWYCFRGEYDSNTVHYNDTSHTNATTECVYVKPTITTEKSANPTSIAEPGGTITFTVKVTNNGGPNGVADVTINSLSDDVYGNLDNKGTCDVPQTIAAGANYSCTFTGPVSGNAGSTHTDTVTASGTDSNANAVSDDDDATVTITDVPPIIATIKAANPTHLNEPGGPVTFSVSVENKSFETVTLTKLEDTIFGDLLDATNPDVTDNTCDNVSKTIAAGAFFTCSFKGSVTGNAGFVHTNTVEACASDNDQSEDCDEGSATVTIDNVLPTIEVTKSANPTELNEPGGTVTFTVSVKNNSFEAVTLTKLEDTIFGDLLDGANPDVTDNTCDNGPFGIAAGATFTCSFKGSVTGNAGFVHTNTVEGCASDNDQTEDCDDGSATVTITDVTPIIATIKAANPTHLNEPGGPVTFSVSVTNNSFEAVTLTSLEDTIYGDLLDATNPDVTDNTCDNGPFGIAAGATFNCSFKGSVTGNAGDTHTNTVEACAEDNDQSEDCDEGSATVTIDDVASSIQVIKEATPTTIVEPGGDITFAVEVTNTSTADSLTISSLLDNVYGVLVGDDDCKVGTVLLPLQSCAFTFTGAVGPDPGFYTDTVTACGTDNDQTEPCDTDDATVHVTDVAPIITVVKSANPTTVPEPGANVTFTVTVTNTSTTDSVMIVQLEDTVYGVLDGDADCKLTTVLEKSGQPGSSCTFDFVREVTGNAGDEHTNTVNVCVVDDEGTGDCDHDDETVTVTDVEPSLTVTKTASDNTVSVGDPVTFTVTVTNTSVEPVTISSLNDSIYGNLATRPGSTCDDLIGDVLGIGGNATCTFTAIATESETNVVTVCIADDDENEECETDDEHVDVLNPGIRIAKVPDAGGVVAGQPIGFRIILFNAGFGNASGIRLRDLLPADVGLNWTIAPSGVGQAWDDQGTSCAIAAGTLECGGAAGVNVPGSLSLENSFFTVHIISTTTAATSANSPVHNEACVESSNEPQICAQADVNVFSLTVEKANDAPVRHIELPEGGFVDIKTQDEGKLVTYTLTYDVGATTVHDVDLTDVLPTGLTFQASPPPTSSNSQLTFVGAVGQTLTWHADALSGDGTVTYVAKVDVGANKIGQLVNTATIDSDETPADTAQSEVFVPAPPKVETHLITGPPTDVLPTQGESGPGSSMMVILATLGLLVIAVSFVTPAPAAVRRRNSRKR